jgi:hypothetical protein
MVDGRGIDLTDDEAMSSDNQTATLNAVFPLCVYFQGRYPHRQSAQSIALTSNAR